MNSLEFSDLSDESESSDDEKLYPIVTQNYAPFTHMQWQQQQPPLFQHNPQLSITNSPNYPHTNFQHHYQPQPQFIAPQNFQSFPFQPLHLHINIVQPIALQPVIENNKRTQPYEDEDGETKRKKDY